MGMRAASFILYARNDFYEESNAHLLLDICFCNLLPAICSYESDWECKKNVGGSADYRHQTQR